MQEKIAVVTSYLQREFPGASFIDARDHDRSAHTFSVKSQDTIFLLTVSFEFFEDNPPKLIRRHLHEWEVASALREAGAHHRLHMTTEGLRFEARR